MVMCWQSGNLGRGYHLPLILFGMFIPYQSILIPLVEFMPKSTCTVALPGLVLTHVIYGIPITTLTFRNYYATIPKELVEAARMDGADILSIYWQYPAAHFSPALWWC